MRKGHLGWGGTALFCLLFGGVSVGALYALVEIQRVPVARLVENLDRQLAANPGDPRVHVNLARLHGMAWALKTEQVPAATRPGAKDFEPWYGYTPDLVPYSDEVKKGSAEEQSAARQHLDKALEHYEAALRLAQDDLLANLGYGWMLEQAGEKSRAIERYRHVIAKAWPSEKDKRMVNPGTRFFTREAAEYLVPLLSPQADADEIRELQSKQAHFERLPRAVTPIVVPLRTGVAWTDIPDRRARVRFDADGSGLRREWTWITSNAGWLVYDAGGRGQISSALQWFGNVTFWLFWENGYHALAALDDNGSGLLEDDELRNLAIWHDENLNGLSEPGEVRPLATHGIVALSSEYREGDGIEFAAVSPHGVRIRTGEIRPSYDVILRSAASRITTDP
jgi:tetratricopeptide (TPR) repeat protein